MTVPDRPMIAPCGGCNAPLDAALRCDPCQASYCPFCGAGHWQRCEHLLAAIQYDAPDGWLLAPFDQTDLAPGPPGLDLAALPPDRLRAACGAAAPLAAAYQFNEATGLACPDQYRLFELLLKSISVWVEPTTSHPAESAAHEGQFGSFTRRPDDARAEIALLLGKLRRGLKRLAAPPESS
jgi:hypothetical protein